MNSVERYYQKKKRRKKKAKVLFFTLLFILMMMTLSILSMTVFFNADTILLEGNTRYSNEEILEAGGLKLGQNLFRLDKFRVIEQMQSLPYVKEVTIRRKLPNTLKIDVVENQPVVWVELGEKAALLNEEYRILEFAELIDLDGAEEPLPEEEGEAEEEPSEEAVEEESATDGSQVEEESATDESQAEDQLVLEDEPKEEEAVIADSKRPALEGTLPYLKGITFEGSEVGGYLSFPEEQDYTGYLKALYEAFCRSETLQWAQVARVDFNARFDIQVHYGATITIDFGTLDRVDTKLELAAYLLEDNGMSRRAIVDVSDIERVYFRPID